MLFGVKFLCFLLYERPYFIALNPLRRQVNQARIQVVGASRAKLNKQLCNGILGNARHANSGADAVTFHQGRYHLCATCVIKLVHDSIMQRSSIRVKYKHKTHLKKTDTQDKISTIGQLGRGFVLQCGQTSTVVSGSGSKVVPWLARKARTVNNPSLPQ